MIDRRDWILAMFRMRTCLHQMTSDRMLLGGYDLILMSIQLFTSPVMTGFVRRKMLHFVEYVEEIDRLSERFRVRPQIHQKVSRIRVL